MRESKIRKLIKLLEESGIDELELSRWGSTVRIIRRSSASQPPPLGSVSASQGAVIETSQPQETPLEQSEGYFEIKAPMVGTFYRSPAPDAPSYVEVGQEIEKDQVVCIVEAMKLMNEIESEVSGTVVKITVENAQPVEFGQTLFLIKPRE